MKTILLALLLSGLAAAQGDGTESQRAAVATLGLPMDVHALVPVVITEITETSMAMSFPFAEPTGAIQVLGVYPNGARFLIDAHVVTVGHEAILTLRSDWLAGFSSFEIVRVAPGSREVLATVGPGASPDGEKGTSTIKCSDGPCEILKEWIGPDGDLKTQTSTVKDGAIIVVPASSAIVVTCLSGCSTT